MIIIGVVAVVLVVLVLVFTMSGKKEPPKDGGGITVVDGPAPETNVAESNADNVDPNAENLDSSDDVFNQLDDAVEFAD